MKNISISLTDQHAAEIDAMIRGGDFASVSEVIRAALREFMRVPGGPSLEQIERDFRKYEAYVASGGRLYTVEEAREQLLGKADA